MARRAGGRPLTMPDLTYLQQNPEVAALLDGADVIDAKYVDAPLTLREFIAAASSYQPAWVSALFRLRSLFAKALRLQNAGAITGQTLRPEDVSFEPGGKALFTCRQAAEDRYWIGGENDSHLNFHVAFVVEPRGGPSSRCHLLTTVCYNNGLGRAYFAVIGPFHHLIVRGMLKHVAQEAAR
ncbi:MAG: DUF2867 domain-containing protein [Anaerolineae bacterium]|nr:DUF2867 domain-containing protein [Anaerolineae bacterium]